MTTDNTIAAFRGLSLPQRMREAAKVLRDADNRGLRQSGSARRSEYSWLPWELETRAEKFEAEDKAAAERDALVEELARWFFDKWPASRPFEDDLSGTKAVCLWLAGAFIDAGWTKAVSDE